MAWLMQLLRGRPRRFANNELGWKNQWGCFSCAFYQRNKPLYRTASHSYTVLPYSRKRWNSILTEIDVVKADQGNIVWNTQTVFREGTKNTHSHEIAPGDDSGKIASLG